MFRALLIKEWTQMRSLRWVGFLLGVLLPPFVLAMTEATQRGWLPFGAVSSYSARDLMLSAVPSLTAMLWGLLALLVTSQAFAADRSAGTETFLLERPVPRSRVWMARLLAALGSMIVLVLGHTAVLAGLAQIVSSPNAAEWSALLRVLLMGLAAILVAFPAGIAAASLLRSPIQGLLLGLVLAAIPPVIASLLGGMFPLARFFVIPIGFVIPWLLLVAYPIASYRMACRGEPGGRGRVKRGLWVLGTTLAAVPLLFLILAPVSLRAFSGRLSYPVLKIASGGSGAAVGVINQGWSNECAWLVDVDSGERLRFLPPPVLGLAWRDDGELAAVIHEFGPLGQRAKLTRLDYYDAAGKRVGETVEFDEKIQWVQRLQWHGDYLLAAAAFPKGHYGILIISPGDGTIREVPIEQHVFTWRLVGPTDDGELYVFRVKDPDTAKEQENPAFVLQRLDVDRGLLDPVPLFEESGFPSFAGKWISPSGRYWLRALGKVGQGMRIVEIETDLEFPLDECLRARWLAGDEIVCLEQQGGSGMRLTVGLPGEERQEFISRDDTSMIFEVSPDRRHLLVQVWDAPTPVESQDAIDPEEINRAIVWIDNEYWATGGRLREAWLFEDGAGPGRQLDAKLGLPAEMAGTHVRWVDTDTLGLVARSGMGFLDMEDDAGARWVFGGP